MQIPKQFTAESANVDKETLIRFYHSNWLARWGSDNAPVWRVEHKAKEALEEYQDKLNDKNRLKRAELISWLALAISAFALWRAW